MGCIRGPRSAACAHPSYGTHVIAWRSIDGYTGPDALRADSATRTRRSALTVIESAINTAGIPRAERGLGIAHCIVSLPTGGTCAE